VVPASTRSRPPPASDGERDEGLTGQGGAAPVHQHEHPGAAAHADAPVRIELDAGHGAQEVGDAAARRGGRARVDDGGAAAQLDRDALRARRHRVQLHRRSSRRTCPREGGRGQGHLLAVRLVPGVADLQRVRAAAGADDESAGGVGDRRRHQMAAGAGAVEELDDGAAQRRAFRAVGGSRQHDRRTAGRHAVMFVLCRCRRGHGRQGTPRGGDRRRVECVRAQT
jgi:hypothetical protein